MASLHQRFLAAGKDKKLTACLTVIAATTAVFAAEPGQRTGPRFLPDDPITVVATGDRVGDLKWRPVDDAFDFLDHSFATPRRAAEALRAGGFNPSRDVNTLDEVPDHSFYTNRHYPRRMTIEEIRRGPGNASPPKGTLVVTGAKNDGITPGFTVRDETGQKYLLKFDPIDHSEMASGADMIGSKLMFALGYFTPENYVIHFRPESLKIAAGAWFMTAGGHRAALTAGHIRRMLRNQPRDKDGLLRALASRWIEGETIGPFKYSGTRSDDPNDVFAHEDRRVLRGLAVFAAWINHTDARAMNSMDTIVEHDGQRLIRHYLIDFGSCFGSDSIFPKLASRGNVFDIEPSTMLKQAVGLGIYSPAWQRARTPRLRGVGRFEAASFEPREWKSAYPNPAFLRMQEGDAFWAAKQVAAVSDAELRAMVETAEYSDPRATEYMFRTLAMRRDKIAAAYLSGRLALDRFRIRDGQLQFDDLRIGRQGRVTISWAGYDNASGAAERWAGVEGAAIPEQAARLAAGRYCVATLRAAGTPAAEAVNVYLRRESVDWAVVGVDREFTSATREVGTK